MSIEETLAEREKTHGAFFDHSRITQNIKRAIRDSTNWTGLTADEKEALDMIAHKIGRILAGNPAVADHWHDIAGYATLVEKELTK